LILDGILLSEAPDEIKDDKESVMAALELQVMNEGVSGQFLEFASDRLKADKEVVMKAVKETPSIGFDLFSRANQDALPQ